MLCANARFCCVINNFQKHAWCNSGAFGLCVRMLLRMFIFYFSSVEECIIKVENALIAVPPITKPLINTKRKVFVPSMVQKMRTNFSNAHTANEREYVRSIRKDANNSILRNASCMELLFSSLFSSLCRCTHLTIKTKTKQFHQRWSEKIVRTREMGAKRKERMWKTKVL